MQSIQDVRFGDLVQSRTFTPSPVEWEDQILYFLLADRFSNGAEKKRYNPETDFDRALQNEESKQAWEQAGGRWNGGTLQGIKSKIGYLKKLGVTAIWISPVFKQPPFVDSYHGYGIQNFLEVDPHLGTREDLKELVDEAHRNGLYVILDIILNHTGDVFRYEEESPQYNGAEFAVKGFHDAQGEPNLPVDPPDPDAAWPDGGIWPKELMTLATFSRKGQIQNWDAHPEYVEGDFMSLKNIHTGTGEGDEFQPSEAFRILCDCFKYWIAYADIDGFRLDTVKHLKQGATRYFAREIHEFATHIGKNNFYIIGEITGGFEFAIDTLKTTGLDAALGINHIPEKLENAAKGYLDPVEFFDLFKNSKLLGEDEYKWYRDNVVSMFDDHDMVTHGGRKRRFCADGPTAPLLANALFLNVMSPGIPCVYYGTEQGFDGAGEGDQYVREAMFEGGFGAFRTVDRHFFNEEHPVYVAFSHMARIRKENPELRLGRCYQREISYDGQGFNLPHKLGPDRHTGVVAWSRILGHSEIVMAINCDLEREQRVWVMVDAQLHEPGQEFTQIYATNADDPVTAMVEDRAEHTCILITLPPAGAAAYRRSR